MAKATRKEPPAAPATVRRPQRRAARRMPRVVVHEAALSARLVHLPPGPEPVRSHRHEGEEWATVLSGRAEARVDEATYRLDEGDAIHFRAWREHGFVNLAAAPTLLLVAHRPRPTL